MFDLILEKYRRDSLSEREKGYRFERLMQNFLKFGRYYEGAFEEVWLWNEFPYNQQFGGKDIGIDIVAKTDAGDYWAVQCKCYDADARIYLDDVAKFVALSNGEFKDDTGKKTFEHKLWIDTTKNGFDLEAQTLVDKQPIKPQRLGYFDLADPSIDWEKIEKGKALKYESYKPREHQRDAINKAHTHFKSHNRGKLIMACGTGKTFTSLKIAEKETEKNGIVLFLVPSIALLGQTLREWMLQRETDIHPICVCSDSSVSNKKDDGIADSMDNLLYPATTDSKRLSKYMNVFMDKQKKNGGLIVIFSTYQSIGEVQKLQKKVNFEFDIIICDEAHRTTGVKFLNENESYFTEVHDNRLLKSKKRLYMTATPRIYADGAKSKAKDMEAILCSMDDAELYGEEFYRIGFGEAVRKDLLSDYKVIVLTMEENQLDSKILAKIEDNEVEPNAALQIIGCINALHKKSLTDKEIFEGIDPEQMHSAVAFCQSIELSKNTVKAFEVIKEAYSEKDIEAKHVDGGMRAQEREEKLQWLKSSKQDKKCRILHNVRCLSEGVDVPALDAILFLSGKNSQIDVIQSVGRVMRKAEGKKYGYIIIPIVVKPDEEPEKALDSNEKYKVIWTVLNALRAHDERFNAEINAINYNKNPAEHIRVTGVSIGGKATDSDANSGANKVIQEQLTLKFETLHKEIYARIVQKCGEKTYWENWARDVADIAKRHISQIKDIVKNNGKAKKEFENYLKGLHKNINPSVSEEEAIEMLAQHKITQPVFDAIFGDFSFAKNNSVSKSLQNIVDILTKSAAQNDFSQLEKFYSSVRERASVIKDNAEGKQKIIVELYDKFFRTAFPKVTEKLGIVYTPIEVVDFIIHSVEAVLKEEFGRSMSDENVHILDPFTGTGTFITRLLQSGIIENKDLKRKYEKEIHANEIVLLAYYIASINIENVYHYLQEQAEKIIELPVEKSNYSGLMAADSKTPVWNVPPNYKAFPGICLTDTFQLGENKEFIDSGFLSNEDYLSKNSEQVLEQQKTPLRIIIGNPPYSVGQKSANDNAQNMEYPKLEKRIAETYAIGSSTTTIKSLYDSYIKAFRWSTDRLDPINGGIICFVSNGSWLDSNGFDGFRGYLEKEFSSINIFNLRGNCRTSGELRQKEAGNVFGLGSRTPISITLLVKNPKQKTEKAIIRYYDIGDYHSRDKKLEIIKEFSNVSNINWNILTPNKHNDWISMRNDLFGTFIQMEPENKFDTSSNSFFNVNSLGINTNRDSWIYNSSKDVLTKNMKNHVAFYNEQVHKLKNALKTKPKLDIDNFRDNSPDKISWSSSLIDNLKRLNDAKFEKDKIFEALYRPYFKQYIYTGDKMIHRRGQFEQFFPTKEHKNIIICLSCMGTTKELSVLISENILDLHFVGDTYCFPLYYYTKKENKNQAQGEFFDKEPEYTRQNGISDFILEQAKERYGSKINREDIFYYVYGILHSPSYRKTFANDLKKMLPRLPLVEKAEDFMAFSKAGRKLAELHLNYEDAPPCKGLTITGEEKNDYKVNSMNFLKKDRKDTIIYNDKITISNIPPKAYEYIVNGKSAVEWVMERYAITTHKDSGIKNDPNDWAAEHNNPRYILDLLLSVIAVSVETVEIVEGLPAVEWG